MIGSRPMNAEGILTRTGTPWQGADSLLLYCAQMAPRGFWATVWEEDLRAPTRDLVGQLFYVIVTVFLDTFSRLALDHSGVEQSIRDLTYEVFNGLTILALANLAIPMALRLLRSTFRAVRR